MKCPLYSIALRPFHLCLRQHNRFASFKRFRCLPVPQHKQKEEIPARQNKI